jgi:hypothetical protein
MRCDGLARVVDGGRGGHLGRGADRELGIG